MLLRCNAAVDADRPGGGGLPLTSTGAGRGRCEAAALQSDNEIIAPAAMVTPLDASSCIACMA